MSSGEHRFRFPPTLAGFAVAAEALRERLDTWDLADGLRYNVEMAFEEAATNIIRHGQAARDVDATITLGLDEIVLTFEDDGVPFDPRHHPAPAFPSSIEEAPVGGLGLPLLRSVLSRMDYERTPEQHNRLTLVLPAR